MCIRDSIGLSGAGKSTLVRCMNYLEVPTEGEVYYDGKPLSEMQLSLIHIYIKRLQKGKCTIEQGFVLSDISTNLERVSDHCSNIAISVIEIDRDGFDAHGYLENLKRDDDPRFQGMVESYRKKYTLPA